MKQTNLALQIAILTLILLATEACSVQISPGEIQFFTGAEPVVMLPTATPTLTPTPTAAPIPTPTLLPTPEYAVVPAAAVSNPLPVPPEQPAPPPITNASKVTILSINGDTAQVLVDGIEHVLPYATLPPPRPPIINYPTPTPAGGITWDSRLPGLGVAVNRIQPYYPGQKVFRLINAQYKDESQAGGLHHIYVEVLNENGQRMLNQSVTQSWSNGQSVGFTENKPAPEYPLNFPIYGAQGEDNYAVFVNGAPSDVVSGMGLPGGNLVAYYLTFQLQ